MRLLIVTDAWHPQVNGVVVTLDHTVDGLRRNGHDVHVLSHEGFRTVPMPGYPEIRLAVGARAGVTRRIESLHPDAIHVATEGPLGLAVRAYCVRSGRPFTTAWHTQFPEYVHARTRLPLAWTYAWLRRFHRPSAAILVGTPAIRDRLTRRGFERLALWSRGVDADLYAPGTRDGKLPRPIFLNVGRIAVEKNLESFLRLDLPGTRVIVGDGPARAALQFRYPDAVFTGTLRGAALSAWYREADVFVFPSRTDTFGLVMIEAMACGTPVAAYPVDGPLDVVAHGTSGFLDPDLRRAALAALSLDRAAVRAHALRYSWDEATRQFERAALGLGRYQ